MGMPDRWSMVRFGFGFGLAFLLLTGPWSAPANTYARVLRSEIHALAPWLPGLGIVQVRQLADPQRPKADLEILLSGPEPAAVRGTRLSSRSLGWMPVAMTLALALATPLDWRRRVKAIGMGVCGMNLLTLLSISLLVLIAGQDEHTPAWQRVTVSIGCQLLVSNLWVSFVGPILLWLVLLVLLDFRTSAGGQPPGSQ